MSYQHQSESNESPAKPKKQESTCYLTANLLNGLETVKARYHKMNFSKHVHEGFTIGLIEQGAQAFYRTGGEHLAGPNSIILVNADDVHDGCSATQSGWAYRALYPMPEQFEQVCDDLLVNNKGIPYFPNAVIEDAQIASQLRLFFDCLDRNESTLLLETIIYAVLTGLVLKHSKTRPCPAKLPAFNQGLYRVRELLEADPTQDISLDELAHIAGMSPYHMLRQFKKLTGLAPHSYQIQARLRLAKILLKQGIKAGQIAVDCGFHDQSHFTHHFKRALGATPKQYQKQSNFLQEIVQ